MAITEAKKKANKKWDSKQKNISFRVPIIWGETFDNYLIDHGIKSKTAWIREAIEEKMEREK